MKETAKGCQFRNVAVIVGSEVLELVAWRANAQVPMQTGAAIAAIGKVKRKYMHEGTELSVMEFVNPASVAGGCEEPSQPRSPSAMTAVATPALRASCSKGRAPSSERSPLSWGTGPRARRLGCPGAFPRSCHRPR